MITQDWIAEEDLQTVLGFLNSDHEQGFLVGGCVRNALMGLSISDIDIATSCDPKTVCLKAKAAGFTVIPTGIDHGTVTILSRSGPLEITTFRQDVETDGRHAKVAFTDNIAQDASRRDFTMNAIYCAANGKVVDPLSGMHDLTNGHVRFIGDPYERIREDHLRILRFFRFTAIYGNPDNGIDPEGLAACSELQDGLDAISKERIGSEFMKLLGARDPAPAVMAMSQAGILGRILPGSDARFLSLLVHFETGFAHDPIRRLAILGETDQTKNLRLSNKQTRYLDVLKNDFDPSGKRTAFEHGVNAGLGAALISATYSETPVANDIERTLQIAADAVFPISSDVLMQYVKGPALGRALSDLKSEWVSSDFTASSEHLLQIFLDRNQKSHYD